MYTCIFPQNASAGDTAHVSFDVMTFMSLGTCYQVAYTPDSMYISAKTDVTEKNMPLPSSRWSFNGVWLLRCQPVMRSRPDKDLQLITRTHVLQAQLASSPEGTPILYPDFKAPY